MRSGRLSDQEKPLSGGGQFNPDLADVKDRPASGSSTMVAHWNHRGSSESF